MNRNKILWRTLMVALAVVFAIVFFNLFPLSSDGAVVDESNASASGFDDNPEGDERVRTELRCPVADPCPTYGERKAQQFRDGKLGNSRGFRFPAPFRDRLDNAYRRWASNNASLGMAEKQADLSYNSDGQHWWDVVSTKVKCGISGALDNPCMPVFDPLKPAKDRLLNMAKDTTKITFGCGAAGFIGAVSRSGYPNAFVWGQGTIGCVFGVLFWSKFKLSGG